MNRCKNIRKLVPLVIENAASLDECSQVKTHCETCESCASFYKEAFMIRKSMIVEKIETPDAYGSELIVNLNRRIDEHQIRRRILWRAIPAFSAMTAAILFVSILVLNGTFRNNTRTETDVVLNETFSQELSGILNLTDSEDEYQNVVVRYVLEDTQQLPIDRYILASSAMDESEFELFVNEIKSVSL